MGGEEGGRWGKVFVGVLGVFFLYVAKLYKFVK